MPVFTSIAIDGPAGAGKSTVARETARRLSFLYVDTGAMYRAVTYLALKNGIDINNAEEVTRLSQSAHIRLITSGQQDGQVVLNGEDVSLAIRSPQVTSGVSQVARIPGVREEMAQRQREMALSCNVVMEGRDIGTVVLPGATFKFFLTAGVEARALRRARELNEKGYAVQTEAIIEEINKRDLMDSTRKVAPLTPPEDAKIIDCSEMSAEQVVSYIIDAVNGRIS